MHIVVHISQLIFARENVKYSQANTILYFMNHARIGRKSITTFESMGPIAYTHKCNCRSVCRSKTNCVHSIVS